MENIKNNRDVYSFLWVYFFQTFFTENLANIFFYRNHTRIGIKINYGSCIRISSAPIWNQKWQNDQNRSICLQYAIARFTSSSHYYYGKCFGYYFFFPFLRLRLLYTDFTFHFISVFFCVLYSVLFSSVWFFDLPSTFTECMFLSNACIGNDSIALLLLILLTTVLCM